MIDAFTPTPASVNTPVRTKSDDWLAHYPDLEGYDRELVRELLKSFASEPIFPERFQAAKSRVVSQMKQLQASTGVLCQSDQQRLKIIGKLINFNEAMKMVKVAPVGYINQPVFSPLEKETRLCSVAGPLVELSEELKALLSVGAGDKTFLAYLERHVRRLYFTPQLKTEIKIVKFDKYNGANEPGTRTLVIDTFAESKNRPYPLWQQAAAIVHDTAHIDYAYRFAADPKMVDFARDERFASIVELEYLYSLHVNDALPEEDQGELAKTYNEIKGRIEQYNRNLGLVENDFQLTRQ